MKWRAVLTVCVAVGSLKLASSSATPPTAAANNTAPQRPSSLAPPNVRPQLTFVADPSLLWKALPSAVAAFVDALTALTSNQPTTTPSPASATHVSPVPPPPVTPATAAPEPCGHRYAVYPNYRTAMPLYATFLRRGFASLQWPPVVVRQSYAATAAEPEDRVSGESTAADPAEPEQPVPGEPETAASRSAVDPPISEPDTAVTSDPDVSPPDSNIVAVVPDRVAVTEKPGDLRPRENPVVIEYKKPRKHPQFVLKAFDYRNENENEIPDAE